MEEVLRVVSYNILSQSFEDYHDYCPKEHRAWNARFAKIVKQIEKWDPDVIGLQELNSRAAQRNFIPKLSPKYKETCSCGNRKGLGVFYKPESLKLINSTSIEFRDYYDDVVEQFEGSSSKKSVLIEDVMEKRDDQALFCHFRHVLSNKDLVFVTVHLFHHPSYPDIKLLQTQALLLQLEVFLRNHSLDIHSTAIVITGDLNSLPIKYLTDEFDTVETSEGLVSAVYELLANSSVSPQHSQHPNSREAIRWKKEHRKKKVKPEHFEYFTELKHPFTLTSACKKFFGTEPGLTTKTNTFQGTLDYIWVSNALTVEKVLPVPQDTDPIPNTEHPSDHFPLIADLLF